MEVGCFLVRKQQMGALGVTVLSVSSSFRTVFRNLEDPRIPLHLPAPPRRSRPLIPQPRVSGPLSVKLGCPGALFPCASRWSRPAGRAACSPRAAPRSAQAHPMHLQLPGWACRPPRAAPKLNAPVQSPSRSLLLASPPLLPISGESRPTSPTQFHHHARAFTYFGLTFSPQEPAQACTAAGSLLVYSEACFLVP